MKKIKTLFKRNFDSDYLVRNEINPGTEWVINGEGHATRKYDGSCCLYLQGNLYRRYELKKGKTPPKNFAPTDDPDPKTGKQPGWVPVKKENPNDKYFVEGLKNTPEQYLEDGTYELIGPKIQGNPETQIRHLLIKHGHEKLTDVPRDYEGLKKYLKKHDIEGIVWHHPDGRMVKIKGKDFGIKRSEVFK